MWAAGERTAAQLTREYALASGMLYRWKHEFDVDGEAAFTGGRRSEPAEDARRTEAALLQRIAELERALGQASLENQILKKGRSLAALRTALP